MPVQHSRLRVLAHEVVVLVQPLMLVRRHVHALLQVFKEQEYSSAIQYQVSQCSIIVRCYQVSLFLLISMA